MWILFIVFIYFITAGVPGLIFCAVCGVGYVLWLIARENAAWERQREQWQKIYGKELGNKLEDEYEAEYRFKKKKPGKK